MNKKILLTIIAIPGALVLNAVVYFLIGLIPQYVNGLDAKSQENLLNNLSYALVFIFIGIFLKIIWSKKK